MIRSTRSGAPLALPALSDLFKSSEGIAICAKHPRTPSPYHRSMPDAPEKGRSGDAQGLDQSQRTVTASPANSTNVSSGRRTTLIAHGVSQGNHSSQAVNWVWF
ncbi:hypothetical protein LshimejAT787_0112620 [Lyophyllum shimeji]|uniref:Uncharacterized protein n=1 Tax=Lyophyllum shimeji TaxID=47721 RepID=A0A9P3PEE7_LYOSH|nr:hypothetical protein LshimejAT787_0112620 [Lyophyllum shimeji]